MEYEQNKTTHTDGDCSCGSISTPTIQQRQLDVRKRSVAGPSHLASSFSIWKPRDRVRGRSRFSRGFSCGVARNDRRYISEVRRDRRHWVFDFASIFDRSDFSSQAG
jgi:hypothetical protein